MTRHRRKITHEGPRLSGKALQDDARKWSWLPICVVIALPLGANLTMLAMIGFHLHSLTWRWQDLTVAAMAVLGAVPLLIAIVLDLSIRWNRANRRRKAKRLGIAIVVPFRPSAD